jgi:hypothetical protein
MFEIWPLKVRSGKPAARRRHGQAAAQHEQVRLGNGEIELDHGRVVERRDQRAGAHEAADADVAESGPAFERGADHGVVEPRASGRDARLVGLQIRLDLLEIGDRERLTRLQVAAAVERTLAARQRRFGLRERRARLRGVHLDEHGAALDFLALLKANCGDRVRRFGRDLDGLVGLSGADGLDLDAHLLEVSRSRDDGNSGRSGRRSRGAGLRRGVGAGGRKERQRDGAELEERADAITTRAEVARAHAFHA